MEIVNGDFVYTRAGMGVVIGRFFDVFSVEIAGSQFYFSRQELMVVK